MYCFFIVRFAVFLPLVLLKSTVFSLKKSKRHGDKKEKNKEAW